MLLTLNGLFISLSQTQSYYFDLQSPKYLPLYYLFDFISYYYLPCLLYFSHTALSLTPEHARHVPTSRCLHLILLLLECSFLRYPTTSKCLCSYVTFSISLSQTISIKNSSTQLPSPFLGFPYPPSLLHFSLSNYLLIYIITSFFYSLYPPVRI